MSLVFGSREIAVGPLRRFQGFGMSSGTYGGGEKASGGAAADESSGVLDFVRSDGGSGDEAGLFRVNCRESMLTESSSIGAASESPGESEGDDEAQSEFKGGLGSMGSLEESLPIKRGLSNFLGGKSRSFATLSDALSVKDLAKPENPFNKRRRILIACRSKPQKRAFYSHLNASMPNIILEEDPEEKGDRGGGSRGETRDLPFPTLPEEGREIKSFRHPRSFSLTDLGDARSPES